MTVNVMVDADACPKNAMSILRSLRHEFGYRLVTVASYNHELRADAGVDDHIMTGAEPEAADLMVANRVAPADIVVTQDWGLAAMVIGKGARALSPSGLVYRPERIGWMLEQRHAAARFRRGGGRTRGPAPRSKADDRRFEAALRELLEDSVLQ